MFLRKRVAELELKLKQHSCVHSFNKFSIYPSCYARGSCEITATCFKCGKPVRRASNNTELLEIIRLLDCFLDTGKLPDKEKDSKKTKGR